MVVLPIGVALAIAGFLFWHLLHWWSPVSHLVLFGGIVLVLLCALILFSTMTVEVDETALRWWFTGRLWTHEIDLRDVADVKAESGSISNGWGIHRVRGVMHYNVSGLELVAVRHHDGGEVRIGTPEPHRLVSAILMRTPAPR